MEQMLRHPEHDRLNETVRSWYTVSTPEMGYEVERDRFGFYIHNTKAEVTPGVILQDVTPVDVPELLADLRGRHGDRPVDLFVDDPVVDAHLGPALVAAGCEPKEATVYLAHVGPVAQPNAVPGLTVAPVDERNLEEWVIAKLKAFGDGDEEPDAAAVRAGIALRRAEMAGEGRFYLARLDGEAAAILGLYDGSDRFIFLVATRAPFRNRGIARHLILATLADAHTRGYRSVLINADENDTPIQLYRGLGFAHEVYRRRRYRLLL
jgi:ribosomal protein S18 acetylase RimI-like enzyme